MAEVFRSTVHGWYLYLEPLQKKKKQAIRVPFPPPPHRGTVSVSIDPRLMLRDLVLPPLYRRGWRCLWVNGCLYTECWQMLSETQEGQLTSTCGSQLPKVAGGPLLLLLANADSFFSLRATVVMKFATQLPRRYGLSDWTKMRLAFPDL